MNRVLRLSAPAALAASAALLLAGCAGGDPASTTAPPSAGAECTTAPSGAASDSVKVDGAFGEATPKAEFTSPLTSDELETSVAIEGDGDPTKPGDVVNVVITMVNGTTGEQVVSQPASLGVADDTLLESFRAAIDCQPFGTRTVTVAPPATLYGETGNETLGVKPDDTVVIIADIVDEYEEPEPEPLPTPAEWTENVPEVQFNGDQAPTVTFPAVDPSPELQEKVLEAGDGAEVKDGDTVTVQYYGIGWGETEPFDSSYGREPAEFPTSGVIAGFGAALVGQKVGSKLIVTIPPEYGYGTDPAAHELGGKTLVFVVEILDTKATE